MNDRPTAGRRDLLLAALVGVITIVHAAEICFVYLDEHDHETARMCLQRGHKPEDCGKLVGLP